MTLQFGKWPSVFFKETTELVTVEKEVHARHSRISRCWRQVFSEVDEGPISFDEEEAESDERLRCFRDK